MKRRHWTSIAAIAVALSMVGEELGLAQIARFIEPMPEGVRGLPAAGAFARQGPRDLLPPPSLPAALRAQSEPGAGTSGRAPTAPEALSLMYGWVALQDAAYRKSGELAKEGGQGWTDLGRELARSAGEQRRGAGSWIDWKIQRLVSLRDLATRRVSELAREGGQGWADLGRELAQEGRRACVDGAGALGRGLRSAAQSLRTSLDWDISRAYRGDARSTESLKNPFPQPPGGGPRPAAPEVPALPAGNVAPKVPFPPRPDVAAEPSVPGEKRGPADVFGLFPAFAAAAGRDDGKVFRDRIAVVKDRNFIAVAMAEVRNPAFAAEPAKPPPQNERADIFGRRRTPEELRRIDEAFRNINTDSAKAMSHGCGNWYQCATDAEGRPVYLYPDGTRVTHYYDQSKPVNERNTEVYEFPDGRTRKSTHCPLVFDLAGRGIRTTPRRIRYDIAADGRPALIHDVAAGLGVLVFDADGNGAPGADGRGLFGDRTDLDGDGRPDGYADGFEALEALTRKAEREGVLARGAMERGRLGPGDLERLGTAYGLAMRVGGLLGKTISLREAGIREIFLARAPSRRQKNFNGLGDDVARREGANFVRSDGSTGAYEDIFFAYEAQDPPRTAGAPAVAPRLIPRAAGLSGRIP